MWIHHRSLRKQLQAHDSVLDLRQNHGGEPRQVLWLWRHPHSLDSSSILPLTFFSSLLIHFCIFEFYSIRFRQPAFGIFDRNIMFVQVLPTTKTTSLEGLWPVCLIFQRRRVLKTSGLCRRMDSRVAKLLIPCGYWNLFPCTIYSFILWLSCIIFRRSAWKPSRLLTERL